MNFALQLLLSTIMVYFVVMILTMVISGVTFLVARQKLGMMRFTPAREYRY